MPASRHSLRLAGHTAAPALLRNGVTREADVIRGHSKLRALPAVRVLIVASTREAIAPRILNLTVGCGRDLASNAARLPLKEGNRKAVIYARQVGDNVGRGNAGHAISLEGVRRFDGAEEPASIIFALQGKAATTPEHIGVSHETRRAPKTTIRICLIVTAGT